MDAQVSPEWDGIKTQVGLPTGDFRSEPTLVTVDKGDLMEAVGMVTGHATVGMLLDDANNMARSLKHKGLMFALGAAIDSNDAAFTKAEKVLLDMLDGKATAT